MFGIIHFGEEAPTCGNQSWLATFTDDPEDVTGCRECLELAAQELRRRSRQPTKNPPATAEAASVGNVSQPAMPAAPGGRQQPLPGRPAPTQRCHHRCRLGELLAATRGQLPATPSACEYARQ